MASGALLCTGRWITAAMEERDVGQVIQRILDKHTSVTYRISSDNGPPFIANDFKVFERLTGLSHVRTSPNYPQCNCKLERFHCILKDRCIRPNCPATYKEEAQKRVTLFIEPYNNVRMHSAISYITPADKLVGLKTKICAGRDRKLNKPRSRWERARKTQRQIESFDRQN